MVGIPLRMQCKSFAQEEESGGINVLKVSVCIALKEGIDDVGESCCVVGLYSMGSGERSCCVSRCIWQVMRSMHLCLGKSSGLRRTTVGVPSAKANNRD
jgi:hypothetical protein